MPPAARPDQRITISRTCWPTADASTQRSCAVALATRADLLRSSHRRSCCSPLVFCSSIQHMRALPAIHLRSMSSQSRARGVHAQATSPQSCCTVIMRSCDHESIVGNLDAVGECEDAGAVARLRFGDAEVELLFGQRVRQTHAPRVLARCLQRLLLLLD